VAVLDNELPIYHTTVDDVTLRKVRTGSKCSALEMSGKL
jgi:hypothetical protein